MQQGFPRLVRAVSNLERMRGIDTHGDKCLVASFALPRNETTKGIQRGIVIGGLFNLRDTADELPEIRRASAQGAKPYCTVTWKQYLALNLALPIIFENYVQAYQRSRE